jgi:PAS domain S-box-containing protein
MNWLRPSVARIGIAVALFVMAIAIFLLTSFEREHLAGVSAAYENYWSSHQLLAEYQQLMVEIIRAENADPTVSAETLQLGIDVVASRRQTLSQGADAKEFTDVPTYHSLLNTLDATLATADRIVATTAGLPLAERARMLRAALAPIEEPVRDFRLSVRRFYAEANDAIRRRLNNYLTMIAAMFAAGALAAVAFVVVYSKQDARLRRSEETFRNTFDHAGVGIGHVSPDGRWLRVNSTLCRLLGRDAEALRSADIRIVFPEVDDFRAMIQPLTSGQTAVLSLDRSYRGSNGTTAHAVFNFALTNKPSGEVDYVILVIEDISERRSIEAQLRQAQKMEAVGQLTGGVAHDFNNLLGVIVGNLDMLDTMLEKSPETRLHLSRAVAAAERGASLTRRLLAFSRRQTLRPQTTDVNRLVNDVITLLRPTIGDKIEIQTELAQDLPPIMVDAGQLEASLVNLAINARDAMNMGGVITVRTAALDPDLIGDVRELVPGNYVVLTVLDTGIGMAPEVLDRVFEPFFTTKDLGRGTGLGLSMVYGFVKQSGGHVQIDSAPGRGTMVRLYLPIAVAAQAEVA